MEDFELSEQEADTPLDNFYSRAVGKRVGILALPLGVELVVGWVFVVKLRGVSRMAFTTTCRDRIDAMREERVKAACRHSCHLLLMVSVLWLHAQEFRKETVIHNVPFAPGIQDLLVHEHVERCLYAACRSQIVLRDKSTGLRCRHAVL